MSLLLLVLFLPFIQLGASLVAALVLLLSRRLDRWDQLRHLGKITLYAFGGSVLGTLVMVLFLVL